MELLKHRINESKKIINQMLSICKNPYIALSFGKDSIVMMDLIYSIAPETPCLFLKSSESYLMYNYEEIIEKYKISHNLNLNIIETDRLGENDNDWEKSRKKGNKDFKLIDCNDFDAVFMGLRIEESKQRRISLIQKKNNEIGKRIMQYKSGDRKGRFRCCPVADWKGYEIEIYCKEKGLQLLDIYEQFGHRIRTTARLTGNAVRSNALDWIKMNKPENYNKLLTLLPELRYV
jgi:3'-phosphoadenosine 5'-phosphosulfate sulfotransferase (PAPS reductase)/FAD synthetase